MIKLFSLEGFLNLSSDTVKRIEDTLSASGLETAEKFDDIDEFIDAVVAGVDEGSTIILSAEKEEYNSVKKQIIDTFSLRECHSVEIQEKASDAAKGFSSYVQDLQGHCLVPLDADIYVAKDGLYSGFCVEFSNGARIIMIPLDDNRLDDILPSVKAELEGTAVFGEHTDIKNEETEENDVSASPDEAEDVSENSPQDDKDENIAVDKESGSNVDAITFDETPNDEIELPENTQAYSGQEEVSDDLFFEEEMILTLKSGEELLVDESEDVDLTGFEEAEAVAAKTAFSLINYDKTVAFVSSEVSPYLLAMGEKVEGLSDTFQVCKIDIENESELEVQVALAKKTRLAILETGSDFAAAISPIIEGEVDGKEIYYSYIVIHDGSSAKAKKVSTATQKGIETLIPHAFSVMFGLVESKAENIAALESDMLEDNENDKKKKAIFLTISVAAAAVAILSAVVMVWSYFQKTPEMLSPTPQIENNSSQEQNSSSAGESLSDTSSNSGFSGLAATDSSFPYPAEPTASDISNVPTSTPFSSTKGTFTFTVYGYGHGVGMSQTGADYYASLGKSYLEILAIYYYGATLVLGDTTPETVKFGNTTYTLRDYLATAVESEMGSSYNTEALKAQVVAIYTFAKYYNFNVPETLHACNKTPSQAAYEAVDIVKGQYMVCNGEIAKPYYHATSAGKTTSYTNVFGDEQIPYLAGGRPSYGDVNAKDYCTTVTFTSDEISALIYSKTGKTLSGDPANWFKILSHDGCINQELGYVSKIQVGDQIYSGYDFRIKVLGGAIRSHCFSFIYTPNA